MNPDIDLAFHRTIAPEHVHLSFTEAADGLHIRREIFRNEDGKYKAACSLGRILLHRQLGSTNFTPSLTYARQWLSKTK